MPTIVVDQLLEDGMMNWYALVSEVDRLDYRQIPDIASFQPGAEVLVNYATKCRNEESNSEYVCSHVDCYSSSILAPELSTSLSSGGGVKISSDISCV